MLSIATGLDIRSVQITRAEKDAFFLFMELRQKYQWASFKMTPRAWVVACSAYNVEVEKKNAAEGKSLQRKTPRALLEKLGEIELVILSRINRKDYKCEFLGPLQLVSAILTNVDSAKFGRYNVLVQALPRRAAADYEAR